MVLIGIGDEQVIQHGSVHAMPNERAGPPLCGAPRVDHRQPPGGMVVKLMMEHGAGTVLDIPISEEPFPPEARLAFPDETSVLKIGDRSACSIIVLSALLAKPRSA